MRKLIKILSTILLSCICQFSFGQDLHFSQYLTAPQNINPALTGLMQGNLRANLNYRNQWFAVNSYATYAASVDANIARKGMDYHMLGLGLSFYQDIESNNGYSNTNISLSTAFNIKVSSFPLQYIGVGVQPSFIKKQINLADAIYGTLFETGVNIDPLGFAEYKTFNFDLNAGLSYYIFFDKRYMLIAGFSMAHITQPDFGINGSDELFRKYTFYFNGDFAANYQESFWMKPSLYFSKQGPSIELMPGIAGRLKFQNAINDLYMTFGVAYRLIAHSDVKVKSGDFIGSAQLHFHQFEVGFSYDVTISSAKVATSRNGGPEISLSMDLDFDPRKRHPRYFKMMKF